MARATATESGAFFPLIVIRIRYTVIRHTQVKALPKPVDAPGRKRGGRRARATKERLGMTDLRKRHYRTNFAEIQEDITQTEIGSTLGQLKGSGAQGAGLRNAEVRCGLCLTLA